HESPRRSRKEASAQCPTRTKEETRWRLGTRHSGQTPKIWRWHDATHRRLGRRFETHRELHLPRPEENDRQIRRARTRVARSLSGQMHEIPFVFADPIEQIRVGQ